MEVIFVRHGESVANVDNLFYGSSDYALTERGKTQAMAAGRLLERIGFSPDRTMVSSLRRTHETLEAMGFPMKNAIVDERLDEMSLGVLEGLTYEEIDAEYPTLFEDWRRDGVRYRPENGENFADFRQRVDAFMEDLAKEKGRILVVCHGGTMKTVVSHVFHMEKALFTQMEVHNCSLLRLKRSNRGFYVDALYNIGDFEETAEQEEERGA